MSEVTAISQHEYDLLFNPEIFNGRTRPPSKGSLEKMLDDDVEGVGVGLCQENSPGSLARKTFGELQEAAVRTVKMLNAIAV
uniref:Uncharacterized protein n=1 Tax=Candidatus Kentrum sp. LPFa TaxID=2126335 RepID=A0A450WCX8_9GAMM|nr:MAG: hypothetical protein BECKLPF1236B_GA0070989_10707 [Candidatus Kentron sp. LPFa]